MKIAGLFLLLYIIFTLSSSPALALTGDESPVVKSKHSSASFSGNVSWYGQKFQGRRTASGELFDKSKNTSAHRTLAFATKVLVEDPKSGNSVIVKVNDRGPFVKSRVMDLSMAAATKLGTISRGAAFVDCMVIN